jgi:hypothetical protein
LSRYVRWSRTVHRQPAQIAVMIVVAPVFLGLLPALVGVVGRRIDRELGLSPLANGAARRVLGAALTTAGFSLGLWSVGAQLDRGRGTPLPMMPTQELLTDGPFRYCRNPMTLGAIPARLPEAPRGAGAGRAVRRGLPRLQALNAVHRPPAPEALARARGQAWPKRPSTHPAAAARPLRARRRAGPIHTGFRAPNWCDRGYARAVNRAR